jgi:hypothetical protein
MIQEQPPARIAVSALSLIGFSFLGTLDVADSEVDVLDSATGPVFLT